MIRGNHTNDSKLDLMYGGNDGNWWEQTEIDADRTDDYGHGRSGCNDISLSPYFG